MNPIDALVDGYLSAVAQATADLPQSRREELLADLRAHIAQARAELDPPTEAGVRTILERLGDPAAIAAEARLGEPADRPDGPVGPGQMGPASPVAAPAPPARSRAWVWVAVVLAAVGAVLVGCVAVVVFGLMSWRTVTVGEDSGPVQVVPLSPMMPERSGFVPPSSR
ncbi:MAG: hypothetical protein FWJ93_02315 [Micromonosporaceae bacterium]